MILIKFMFKYAANKHKNNSRLCHKRKLDGNKLVPRNSLFYYIAD